MARFTIRQLTSLSILNGYTDYVVKSFSSPGGNTVRAKTTGPNLAQRAARFATIG